MSETLSTDAELNRLPTLEDFRRLQFSTLLYYLHETNPDNGLVRDKTEPTTPASIAAIGMALATVPVIVERGIIIRKFAAKLTRRRLRYLLELPQGPEPDASGYKGFFYHFLDIETGRRVWQCELSTIDSAFLFAGALMVATYFDHDTPEEAEIRQLATELYERADWNWACDGGLTLTHGWHPGNGFIPHRWRGYDEGLLLYLLGLGSPTHPRATPPIPRPTIGKRSTVANCSIRGPSSPINCRICGSIFGASATHSCGSVTATISRTPAGNLRAAGICNPQPDELGRLREYCWGFTACDGPGWIKREIDGVKREFFDYIARGAPFGPDDGTVAPWVVIASLPFAPEIVIPTARNFAQLNLGMTRLYGFKPSFNQSFPVEDSPTGWWVTPNHFGIDQGPVVLMVENYRTGLLWNIMRRCQPLLTGLRRAGFAGGWP
jgi:hypothetical protein